MYHLYQYLGFSDYDLVNMVENMLHNKYSQEYKLYHQLDEFKVVKYQQLSEGPVAYTQCKDKSCAIQRFKDELLYICPQGKKIDQQLLSAMIDTNTKEFDRKLAKKISL